MKLLFLLIVIAVSGCTLTAQAQNYPVRPIRLVVGTTPGAGSDIVARLIAPKLSEYLGQQVVVENRAGAGQMIGTEFVARSAPDGYTLLFFGINLAINPSMYKKVPYDALRDLAFVTQVVSLCDMLISHPSLPVHTVQELIAFAKSRPGQLNYASAGVGTAPQLFMELFLGMTGLKVVHVPYKGAGPAIIDVVAGHVPLSMPSVFAPLPYVREGRLRGLGVTSAKRVSAAPNIPTIAEAGVPGYEATSWFGVAAPAATPREIVNLLYSNVLRVLQQPDISKRLAADGGDAVGSTPDECAAFIRSEIPKWAKVVRSAGIEPE